MKIININLSKTFYIKRMGKKIRDKGQEKNRKKEKVYMHVLELYHII